MIILKIGVIILNPAKLFRVRKSKILSTFLKTSGILTSFQDNRVGLR